MFYPRLLAATGIGGSLLALLDLPSELKEIGALGAVILVVVIFIKDRRNDRRDKKEEAERLLATFSGAVTSQTSAFQHATASFESAMVRLASENERDREARAKAQHDFRDSIHGQFVRLEEKLLGKQDKQQESRRRSDGEGRRE